MNPHLIQKQAQRIVNYSELLERKKRWYHGDRQAGFIDRDTKRFFEVESKSKFEARQAKSREVIAFIERRIAQAIEDLTKLT